MSFAAAAAGTASVDFGAPLLFACRPLFIIRHVRLRPGFFPALLFWILLVVSWFVVPLCVLIYMFPTTLQRPIVYCTPLLLPQPIPSRSLAPRTTSLARFFNSPRPLLLVDSSSSRRSSVVCVVHTPVATATTTNTHPPPLLSPFVCTGTDDLYLSLSTSFTLVGCRLWLARSLARAGTRLTCSLPSGTRLLRRRRHCSRHAHPFSAVTCDTHTLLRRCINRPPPPPPSCCCYCPPAT